MEIVLESAVKPGVPTVRILDEDQVKWFVGFLDGRLEVITPAWVSSVLQRAEVRVEGSGTLLRPRCDVMTGRWLADVTPVWREQYRKMETLVGGGDVVGEAVTDFLGMCIDTDRMGRERFVYKVGNDYLIPAVRSSGFSWWLARVNGDSGTIMWKTKVTAAGRQGASGAGFHIIDIDVVGDRIVVFGCEPWALYCEIIDVNRGVVLRRFCTGYVID
jgi:hypothetical protein